MKVFGFGLGFVIVLTACRLCFGVDSITVNTNAVIIPDVCLTVNYDCTDEQLEEAIIAFKKYRDEKE